MFRSRSCGFIVGQEVGAGVLCPECVILASFLLQTPAVKTDDSMAMEESDSLKKKRGRPKGSKRKLKQEDSIKDKSEEEKSEDKDEDWQDEDVDTYHDDSEDYLPDKVTPKAPPPSQPKTAKHFCPHDGCSLVFVTLQQLKVHLEGHDFVHCGRPAVMCSHARCASVFHSQEELKDHLPSHNERKHSCSVCPKSFTTKQDLKIHSRTHSGKAWIF